MARTSFSEKRMVIPFSVTSKRSSSPAVENHQPHQLVAVAQVDGR